MAAPGTASYDAAAWIVSGKAVTFGQWQLRWGFRFGQATHGRGDAGRVAERDPGCRSGAQFAAGAAPPGGENDDIGMALNPAAG
jgi:hypothetical protein